MTTPSTQNNGFDLNQPTIISLLYLAGFLTGGLTSLVGIVLAHVWQGDNQDEWAASHFSYLIRTFWISLVGFVIAFVLMFLLIGFLLFPLLAIWVGVRSVMSLIKAQKQEPMPDPATLLI
ncbi:DUF4870 domain-containing protein [Erythrobacter sp. Alg231-14]|uniref:DUF4870 domain-containing protein n=1 Tax=Erythrobacter sp. Alg231-14 TaxID=1922225 RepID=UPI000D561505